MCYIQGGKNTPHGMNLSSVFCAAFAFTKLFLLAEIAIFFSQSFKICHSSTAINARDTFKKCTTRLSASKKGPLNCWIHSYHEQTRLSSKKEQRYEIKSVEEKSWHVKGTIFFMQENVMCIILLSHVSHQRNPCLP